MRIVKMALSFPFMIFAYVWCLILLWSMFIIILLWYNLKTAKESFNRLREYLINYFKYEQKKVSKENV